MHELKCPQRLTPPERSKQDFGAELNMTFLVPAAVAHPPSFPAHVLADRSSAAPTNTGTEPMLSVLGRLGAHCFALLHSIALDHPVQKWLGAVVQAVFQGTANKALSNGAASSLGEFSNIHMNGSEVFKFAVRAVPSVSHLPGSCCTCKCLWSWL